MRGKGLILVTAIAIIAIAFAILRIADSTYDNRHRATKEVFSGIIANYSGEDMCEVLVDLGCVTYGSTATSQIRITNNSNEPMVLVDYTTQCRCMWLDFERKTVEVGESCDITLSFDSKGEWGSIGNYMEIITSKQEASVVLWIGAEVE